MSTAQSMGRMEGWPWTIFDKPSTIIISQEAPNRKESM